jgi:hypothetical protein
MNYSKIYNSIIAQAKSENRIKHRGIYFENHHILPKSLGGGNEEKNLVLLTAREHFICHKLLLHIYSFNESMIRAFHRMCHTGNGDFIKSSRDYKYARILMSDMLKKTRTGEGNPMYGKKLSKESKEKIRIKSTGRRHTKNTKEKLSKSHKGEKNGMFGKPSAYKGVPCPDDKKKQLSLSAKKIPKKECEYCHKYISPQNYGKYHGPKCKLNKIK